MTIAGTMETWTETLRASHDRVRAAAETARHGASLLAHATAGRIVAAWTLAPAPRDPSTHLDATHARCRRCLERLVKWPSGGTEADDSIVDSSVKRTAGRPAGLPLPWPVVWSSPHHPFASRGQRRGGA